MRLLIVASIIGLITSFDTTRGIVEEADAPFIYYYQPLEHVIIFERADGADRNAIDLYDVLPESHNFVRNVEFSPSGNWLTWLSVPIPPEQLMNEVLGRGWGSLHAARAWIASTSDLENIRQINDLDIIDLEWSPIDDQFVLSYVPDGEYEDSAPHAMVLIDAVTLTQTPIDLALFQFEYPRWTTDGRHIFVETTLDYHEPLDDNYDYVENAQVWRQFYDTPRLITISIEGDIIERAIDYFGRNDVVGLPDGRLLYRSVNNERIVIENIVSGEIVDLDDNLVTIGDHALIWSPDRRQTLFLGESQSGYLLAWLLSLDDSHVISIALPDLWMDLDPYAPPNVFFTPVGDRILFAKRDGTIWWYHVDSMTTTQEGLVDLPLITSSYLPHIDAKWLSDGRGIIMVNQVLWLYDLNTDTLSSTSFENRHSFSLSNDERFLAMFRPCELSQPHGKCIIEFDTGLPNEIPPYDADTLFGDMKPDFYFYPQGRGFIDWHLTENWVIFGEDYESWKPAYSVTDAGGEYYRDIPMWSKPRWLPDNVPLDDFD